MYYKYTCTLQTANAHVHIIVHVTHVHVYIISTHVLYKLQMHIYTSLHMLHMYIHKYTCILQTIEALNIANPWREHTLLQAC